MLNVLHLLIALALIAVAATLALGVLSLARGGEFRRNWSNRLMRLRVALQFVAIVLLAAALYWGHRGH